MTTIIQRSIKTTLILIIALCLSFGVIARQWSPSGGDAILNTGNVGIGTNGPNNKLVVVPNSSTESVIVVRNSGNGADRIRLGLSGNSGQISVHNSNNSKISQISSYQNSYIQGGNFGIGTNSPARALDVKGGVAGNTNSRVLRLSETSNSDRYDFSLETDDYLRLNNGTSDAILMSWGKYGNIGIGTAQPGNKLVVVPNTSSENVIVVRNAGNGADRVRLGLSGNSGQLSVHNSNNSQISQISSYQNSFIQGGNFGIGTNSPARTLDVKGGVAGSTNSRVLRLSETSNTDRYDFSLETDDFLRLNNGTSDATLMSWGKNGNVGIGTNAPSQKLSVDGKINAEEIVLEDVVGADFVFEEDYDLRSLEETEQFIKANKHLPEIPSAVEMAEDGLELKQMNILLLQKVEELTLHLIRIEKEAEEMRQRLNVLEEK